MFKGFLPLGPDDFCWADWRIIKLLGPRVGVLFCHAMTEAERLSGGGDGDEILSRIIERMNGDRDDGGLWFEWSPSEIKRRINVNHHRQRVGFRRLIDRGWLVPVSPRVLRFDFARIREDIPPNSTEEDV